MTEIRVPTLGKSVTEATIGRWFKKAGDAVAVDEPLVELETDKVTIEVPAPSAGVLGEITAKDGETVAVGALLGQINEGAAAAAKPAAAPAKAAAAPAAPAPAAAPAAAAKAAPADAPLAPSVRKISAETGIDAATVPGSGKDGRVTKGDMLAAIEKAASAPTPVNQPAAAVQVRSALAGRRCRARRARQDDPAAPDHRAPSEGRAEHRRDADDLQRGRHDATSWRCGPSTRTCSRRSTAASWDLWASSPRPACRRSRTFRPSTPRSTAPILIYKNYYHVGVAVGTDKGLVVPVVRDCDQKSIAGIEKSIADFGRRARDGQLKIDEMQGGTFTITNGGIYGSLMSTPILNAPQSAILGMHKIQERPMAIGGKVEIRPMMYLALSYDHRVIDGKEAVTFLVRVKESLEDPARLVLDL